MITAELAHPDGGANMAGGIGRSRTQRASEIAGIVLLAGLTGCAPLTVAGQARVASTINPPGAPNSVPSAPASQSPPVASAAAVENPATSPATPTGSISPTLPPPADPFGSGTDPATPPSGAPTQPAPVTTGGSVATGPLGPAVPVAPRRALPGLPEPGQHPVAVAPNPDAVDSSMELPPPTGLTPSTTALTRTMHRKGKWVSITIDDGPDPAHTPQVLDMLARYRVRGVFCVVGEMVQEYPDLVRRIAAEGHLFCNHSMFHSMELGRRSKSEILAELNRVNNLIRQVVPGAPILWFRAPGAAFTPRLNAAAAQLGMQPLAWSVDPMDWQRPPARTIVERIKKQVGPTGVILVHDGGGSRTQTLKALAEILPWLRQQGYRFDDPGIGPA